MAHERADRTAQAAGRLSDMAGCIHGAMARCGARVRVEILSHLVCGPMSVGELASALSLDHTLISKYLKVLTAGGLTQMRRVKTSHIFSLAQGVRVRAEGEVIELRVPVEGGLYIAIALSRAIVKDLHPEAMFAEATPPVLFAVPGRQTHPAVIDVPTRPPQGAPQPGPSTRRSSQSQAT